MSQLRLHFSYHPSASLSVVYRRRLMMQQRLNRSKREGGRTRTDEDAARRVSQGEKRNRWK